MGKSPGFWFFTGDWMKDPELRFCSIFARGLLVDLLCLMFESKTMGFLCRPDGGPRDDIEIVDAIAGGSREEKLSALVELVNSGVLSRDSDGVLFSRRLARLSDVSKERSKAGSKGGSKTQAKLKQTNKQNRGVTDSDSVSDTSNRYTYSSPVILAFDSEEYKESWSKWMAYRSQVKDSFVDDYQAQENQIFLKRLGEAGAIDAITYTISNGWRNLQVRPKTESQPSQKRYRDKSINLDIPITDGSDK